MRHYPKAPRPLRDAPATTSPFTEHRGWCQIFAGAVGMVLCARCAAWWGAQGACVCASQPPANISSLQRRRRCYSATEVTADKNQHRKRKQIQWGGPWQSRDQMHIRIRRETTAVRTRLHNLSSGYAFTTAGAEGPISASLSPFKKARPGLYSKSHFAWRKQTCLS